MPGNPSSAELAARALGAPEDVGAVGDGSVIAVLKRIRDAGGLAPSQSLKTYVARVTAGVGVTTLTPWTVTAGKTLYISDIFIDSDGSLMKDIQIQAAAVAIWRAQVRDLVPVRASGIETQPQASSGQGVTVVIPIGAENYDIALYAYEQ